jgi:hypothetical protein
MSKRMNEIAKFIVKELDIEIKTTVSEVNHYIPDENTVYINALNNTLTGMLIKAVYNRPVSARWSLYHELGHAFVHMRSLEDNRKVKKLFGSFDDEYPEDGLSIAKGMKSVPEGFITAYATVHPEEDFAECFAYVLSTYYEEEWEDFDDVIVKKCELIMEEISKFLIEHDYKGWRWD